MQQSIGILVETDPTPAWTNLSLYSYEEEYIPILISSDNINGRHPLAITCSKLTMERLEQGVKYVQS